MKPPPLHRRWLVVDDEPALCELVASQLAALGLAEVESFVSPIAALAQFAGRPGGFDLVVTDRDMPDCNGLEFARRVREHAPATMVILVTARGDDLTTDDLRRAGVSAVLPKPFSIARFEALVCAAA